MVVEDFLIVDIQKTYKTRFFLVFLCYNNYNREVIYMVFEELNFFEVWLYVLFNPVVWFFLAPVLLFKYYLPVIRNKMNVKKIVIKAVTLL